MMIAALVVFLLAYYYFVLRRFNSLGFRLFSVFGFAAIGVLWWWLGDWRELSALRRAGVVATARVLDLQTHGKQREVTVQFADSRGQPLTRTQHDAISDAEFAALRVGGAVEVIYQPDTELFYLKPSFDRWRHDHPYVLIFPGTLLLLGTLAWIFLHRFKVLVRDSGQEYVVDESGKVVLDDGPRGQRAPDTAP